MVLGLVVLGLGGRLLLQLHAGRALAETVANSRTSASSWARQTQRQCTSWYHSKSKSGREFIARCLFARQRFATRPVAIALFRARYDWKYLIEISASADRRALTEEFLGEELIVGPA